MKNRILAGKQLSKHKLCEQKECKVVHSVWCGCTSRTINCSGEFVKSHGEHSSLHAKTRSLVGSF